MVYIYNGARAVSVNDEDVEGYLKSNPSWRLATDEEIAADRGESLPAGGDEGKGVEPEPTAKPKRKGR